ncbi:MAG: YfiR family protein [Pseudomonadota bacterium]
MALKVMSFGRMAVLVIASTFGACGPSLADPYPLRESAVKAAFLFKFGSFVEWPRDVFPKPDTPMVIGVAGDDAVANDLESLIASRTAEGRPIVARRVNDLGRTGDIHILFVGNQRETRFREALLSLKGPILVVTDQDNGLRLGSVINFSPVDGRVRFSVSLAAAEARSLKLSARLLAVAQVVEGANR